MDSVVGGYSVGETPGPIPNPEAKPFSADGTALGRVWESRTLPAFTCLGGVGFGLVESETNPFLFVASGYLSPRDRRVCAGAP